MSDQLKELRDLAALDAMRFFLEAVEKRKTTLDFDSIARASYAMADAMLKARKK